MKLREAKQLRDNAPNWDEIHWELPGFDRRMPSWLGNSTLSKKVDLNQNDPTLAPDYHFAPPGHFFWWDGSYEGKINVKKLNTVQFQPVGIFYNILRQPQLATQFGVGATYRTRPREAIKNDNGKKLPRFFTFMYIDRDTKDCIGAGVYTYMSRRFEFECIHTFRIPEFHPANDLITQTWEYIITPEENYLFLPAEKTHLKQMPMIRAAYGEQPELPVIDIKEYTQRNYIPVHTDDDLYYLKRFLPKVKHMNIPLSMTIEEWHALQIIVLTISLHIGGDGTIVSSMPI